MGRDAMTSAPGGPDTEPMPARRLGRASSMRITAASLAGAVAGYVVLAIAARTLTLEDNALFVTFWAALLTSYGILTGLNTETSRAVAQSAVGTGTGVRAPRAGTVAAVVAAGVAVVCLGTAPLWGGLVFGEDSRVLATVVAASAAAYAVQATLLGALSGRGSWDPYAAVIAVEALGRVLIVTLVALWASDVVPLAWAAGAAAAAWTIMLVVSPASRAALASRVDAPLRAFLARSAVAAVAAGASAVLLVGFPVLTSLTTPAAVYAGAAPLMLAITLTRAPIMVPLTSFQSVIVSQFVHNQEGAGRAFLKFSGVVLAVGVVGAALAYPVGPPLMALLFGEGYRVDGIVLSAMTFASAGTALLTISGAFCQARNRHGAFVTGWLVALVVSVAILAVDADVTARVVGALVVGPYCGLAVHLAALRRELVRRRPTG